MKDIIAKVLAILKAFKFHWWIVYAAFAFLVYSHIFGLWGTVGMTVLLIILNGKIHELD